MNWTHIVTICAFSFVPWKTLWTTRNRKLASLLLNIPVWPMSHTIFPPKQTMNEAPKAGDPLNVLASFSFKDVDVTKAMNTPLFLDSLVEHRIRRIRKSSLQNAVCALQNSKKKMAGSERSIGKKVNLKYSSRRSTRYKSKKCGMSPDYEGKSIKITINRC